MSTKKRKLHESSMDKNSKEAEPNKSEKCRKTGFGAKVVGFLRTLHGKLASIFTSPTQKNAREMSVGEMRDNRRGYSDRKRKSEEHSEEESVVLRKRRKLSSEARPPELQLHSNASDDILEANQASQGRKRSRSSEEDSEAERVKRFKGDKTGSEESQCPDETKAGGLAGPITSFNFTIDRELGSGSFGKVVLAKENITGQLMAIKVIRKDSESASFVMSERRILEAAQDCPFLVHAYAAFQTEEEILFIMEYIPGGTLHDLLERRGALDIGTARNLAAEIVCGLNFLHSRGIIHRDLKPENILIDSAGHIKIADFGLAVEGVFGGETTTGYAGTRGYIAPEISKGGAYDSTVDFWSLGVILHEMLTGRMPAFTKRIKKLKCPANLRPEEKDILNMLLCRDRIKRLDFVQCIKEHPFFESTDWLALEGGTTELPVTTPPEEKKSSFSSGQDPYEGLNFVSQEWMNKHGSPSSPEKNNTRSSGEHRKGYK